MRSPSNARLHQRMVHERAGMSLKIPRNNPGKMLLLGVVNAYKP